MADFLISVMKEVLGQFGLAVHEPNGGEGDDLRAVLGVGVDVLQIRPVLDQVPVPGLDGGDDGVGQDVGRDVLLEGFKLQGNEVP